MIDYCGIRKVYENGKRCLNYSSGIAGLRLALELSPFAKGFILTKKELLHSNTRWAQGGIAAAWKMTMIGNHMLKIHWLLFRFEVVEVVGLVAKQGKQRVQELIELGVRFDKKEDDNGTYSLHKEGDIPHIVFFTLKT